MGASAAPLYTIGHSTRTAEAFLALLQAHAVGQIADVRAFPMSRRLPHFNREALTAMLAQRGVGYRHFPSLGGRRTPRPDSTNGAWQHDSFRGYADYMATPEFEAGLEELLQYAQSGREPGPPTRSAAAGWELGREAGRETGATAVMCAEAVWWRCHRRLIADALVARHVPVFHIMTIERVEPHELTSFAVVRGAVVTYPGLLNLPH